MQILLVAATEHEIQPLIMTSGIADVLITGVGIAATIYHLQKRLQQLDYDFVIQAGIAGTFGKEINLGETVLVKQDTFGDMGIEEKGNFKTIFKAGFANADEFPFEDGWLINKNKILNTSSLLIVRAITVNKVSD